MGTPVTAPMLETLKQALVLDPVERVSDIVNGVLVGLALTGSVSVASAGHEQIITMLAAALGGNLGWALTNAVMYLVSTATERQRKVTLLQRVQSTQDKTETHRLIADSLPYQLGDDKAAVEALRKWLVARPAPAAGLGARDYLGAFGVFALVSLATLHVVLPFVFIQEPRVALRVSNALALATLFSGGLVLGRYAGGSPWRWGLAMVAIGTALVAIIIALGG